ncbi:hypothetical protein FRB96_002842 [Tulasnella sp. 330]|nr:hypothetical protein FRB96_002842 [Tulasnella sp. 330]
MAITDLGVALQTTFKETGMKVDLDARVAYLHSFNPHRHADRSYTFKHIAKALMDRFDEENNLNDVDSVIAYQREDLSSALSIIHNTTEALSHCSAEDLNGRSKDLYGSVDFRLEQLSLCPIHHTTRSTAFNNLDTARWIQFLQEGDRANLDASAQRQLEGLALQPPGHPSHFAASHDPDGSLWYQFDYAKKSSDLDASINSPL